MINDDCIFCKIVAGEIPSVKLFENDRVLAFMDIGPIIKGHALVIPKTHYDPLMDTPEPVLAEVIAVVKRIARAQVAGLGADGINVTQANGECAGQVVPHLHFHVIPRFRTDGHHWNWKARSYDNRDEMQALATRITGAMDRPGETPCTRT